MMKMFMIATRKRKKCRDQGADNVPEVFKRLEFVLQRAGRKRDNYCHEHNDRGVAQGKEKSPR